MAKVKQQQVADEQDPVFSSQEPGAESPEWTPRDWAEFLTADQEAMRLLFDALAKPPHVSFTEEDRAKFEQALRDAPDGGIIRIPNAAPRPPRLLGIGQSCAWFEAGDETRVPLPALVIGNDGVDMVSLEVRYPNGTRREFHGVLALGSPRLVAEPQHAANGAWDDAAIAEARRAERHAKAAAAAAKRASERKLRQEADRKLREEEADQLVSMVASGLGFDEAIRKLGPHWTIDLAQTYWKKTGRVLPRTAVA